MLISITPNCNDWFELGVLAYRVRCMLACLVDGCCSRACLRVCVWECAAWEWLPCCGLSDPGSIEKSAKTRTLRPDGTVEARGSKRDRDRPPRIQETEQGQNETPVSTKETGDATRLATYGSPGCRQHLDDEARSSGRKRTHSGSRGHRKRTGGAKKDRARSTPRRSRTVPCWKKCVVRRTTRGVAGGTTIVASVDAETMPGSEHGRENHRADRDREVALPCRHGFQTLGSANVCSGASLCESIAWHAWLAATALLRAQVFFSSRFWLVRGFLATVFNTRNH
uniref:Uncharacterized protein n=1 Tax=Pseudo-nitzschia australis TaxID=44445 RepID=A0A7S4AU55_9STRA